MSDERENLSYELFGTAVRDLAAEIADDGFEPDMVLSIARGGLFVAGGLGYALDVKNLHVMNTGLNITGTTTEVFRYGNDLRGSSLSDGSSDPVTAPTDLT